MSRPKVVALGGGHGLAVSLAALRLVTDDITAVVTVADDGGSSGRLREEFGVLPPGDLRMALSALCDDSEWGHTWRDVLQHRFRGQGQLGGHALGNLLIVSLWDLLGDTVAGLDLVGGLLNARGRVLPMAAVPLQIEAEVLGGDPARPGDVTTVRGQHLVASTSGRVQSVRIIPPDPPCCVETIDALLRADWVFLGPGSWFTSVLLHVLVPELRQALARTPARIVLNLNVEVHTAETRGFRAVDHLDALARHAPELRLYAVLVDPRVLDDEAEIAAAAAAMGARLVVSDVSAPGRTGHHDSLRLAAAYRDLIG
ncbi:MAG: uridine diphosphate-N-acetylglucosamine-binding protein YvcK [Dermatophilaceae bacterium]